MNMNALQTLLAGLLVALPAFLVAIGCTQNATGALECSNAPIHPTAALILITVVAALKIILPAFQDGGWFRNLFSRKVPVATDGAKGTVPPQAINK